MKIYQVITRADTIGGAQKHVYDLSNQLKSDGHQISILSSGKGEFRTLIEKSDIDFINIKWLKREFSIRHDFNCILSMRSLIKKNNPDIVAIHSAKAGLLCRLACIGLKNKVVFTAHGWSHIRDAKKSKHNVFVLIERFLSKFTDKIICVSKADMTYSLDTIKISGNKLFHCPNGVKDSSAKVPNTAHRADNKLKLLSVVRFQAPKDFNTLIDALEIIKDGNWELSIIGDGEDMELVNDLIRDKCLQAKVFILGFKNNVQPFYEACDAVVLISRSEGLPMSLIEAMSYSKAIIGSSVGGIPELIKDDWNGYLIDSNDAITLSNKINTFIDNKNKPIEMGIKSFEMYKDNYSFEKMMMNIYHAYGIDLK